jgi:hypothetical protein
MECLLITRVRCIYQVNNYIRKMKVVLPYINNYIRTMKVVLPYINYSLSLVMKNKLDFGEKLTIVSPSMSSGSLVYYLVFN